MSLRGLVAGVYGIEVELTAKHRDDDTVFDLSPFETVEVVIRKPDGGEVIREGSMVGDGTDGRFTFPVLEGDLPVEGEYRLQVVLRRMGLAVRKGQVTEFYVNESL